MGDSGIRAFKGFGGFGGCATVPRHAHGIGQRQSGQSSKQNGRGIAKDWGAGLGGIVGIFGGLGVILNQTLNSKTLTPKL